VGSNISSPTDLLPSNGTVELAFDRLLSPLCISRQTFVLHDVEGSVITTIVAYDPVARIVSLAPLWQLDTYHVYEVDVLPPSSPADPNGLRAIDGATLAEAPLSIAFSVGDADTSAQALPSAPAIDFCRDVFPVFGSKCGTSGCHGGPLPVEGLSLDSPAGVSMTAIGQIARGANTGPTSSPQPPSITFGLNMPLIDPGPGSPAAGNPGDSWLLYKLLMEEPVATASTPYESDCDGGTLAPANTAPAHVVDWQPLAASERCALSSVMCGQAMPPPSSSADGGENTALSSDELERLSLWIAAGAAVPSECACSTASQ
jgi:hypothetical protein